MTRSLALTGFMGCGKSSAGQLVAERLGRPFVDMDAEIERRLGKEVERIFAEDGEAVFRAAERALCAELTASEGLIIAAGGGTLQDPDNCALLLKHTDLVCLRCDADEVLRRLEGGRKRPLLEVHDRQGEIGRLLKKRAASYSLAPWQIDTTHLGLDEVSLQVQAIAERRRLSVRHPDGSYPIHISPGILDHTGSLLGLNGISKGRTVALVTNPLVGGYYAARVQQSLAQAGYRVVVCQVGDGEAHKTLETVADLYAQFAAAGLERGSLVLALGGGVTGDIAGMAAGTYLRGVAFAQAPTTLLAMVDSSVGGKTGVDLPQGKNLVGVFKQPEVVIIDPVVLETLPLEELRCGMAETIKHAIIGDETLFADLECSSAQPLAQAWRQTAPGQSWLERSLRVKMTVVEEDPFEQGRRAVLNLGHTMGHAFEKVSGFRLRHGEAVAIGIVAAARLAVRMGLARTYLAERVETLLAASGLPVRCPPFEMETVLEATQQDKKKSGKRLRWALPLAIGRVEVVEDVPLSLVEEILVEMGAVRHQERKKAPE